MRHRLSLQPRLGRMETRLTLPSGTLSGEPRLEISGRRCFFLEGRCEIQGCEEDLLLLKTACGLLRLRGRNLCILSLSDSELRVEGHLISLEYLD